MDFDDKVGLKQRAKAASRATKEKMLAESGGLIKEGKTALEAKDYKLAINKFNQAVEYSPDNPDVVSARDKALSELHFEIKNLYAESVIEENLGNIESAKRKWRTILDQDVKSDQYYEKAQIKLRKYER